MESKPLAPTRATTIVLRDIEELAKMVSGRGWVLVQESLASEREAVIRAITAHPDTPKEVLDFHRATLRAIDIMINHPQRLRAMLDVEFEIAKASEAVATPKGKPHGSE